MIPRTELIMRRRLVREFIRADWSDIVIERPRGVEQTAAGGFVRLPGAPIKLDPQRVRIVPNKRRFDPGLVNSEAGAIPDTGYLLLAEHTFDGKVDDIFSWMGKQYTITGIHPTRTESFLASIDYEGAPNNGRERQLV